MTNIEIWKTAVYDGEIYEGLYKVSNGVMHKSDFEKISLFFCILYS